MIFSPSAPGRPRASWAALGDSGLVAGFAFAVVALLSFLFFREPPILSDQLDYFSTAWALPDVRPDHRHLRIGLVWPVWALTRAFDYSEFAYYGIPLLTRFLLGFATWWLGRQMFSPRVGWIAGLLIMLTPGYTRVASQLLPDYFSAALLTLAMGLIYKALHAPRPVAGRSGLLMLAAGASVGWAYLTREYAVILFPCFGLAMLLLRAGPRSWLYFCCGALAIYSLEPLWGWLNYGDPLIRLSSSASPRETSRAFATAIADILLLLPRAFATYGGWPVSAFVVLGIAAPAVMLWRGPPAWRILAAWSLLGWVVLTTIALLPVILFDGKAVYLRLHMFRYWSIIFPPVFIGATAAVFALADWASGRVGNRAALAVAALLLALPVGGTAVGLYQVAAVKSLVRNAGTGYAEFREFLRGHPSPPKVLWMDRSTGIAGSNSLPIYLRSPSGWGWRWEGEIRYLNSSRSKWLAQGQISGGLIALDRTRARDMPAHRAPQYYLTPDAAWPVAFRSSNGNVLLLDPGSGSAEHGDIEIPAGALQVLRAGRADGAYTSALTPENTLRVQVQGRARVVVVDGAARGLAAPPPGAGGVPRSATQIRGEVALAGAGLPGQSAVRCLLYDAEGRREEVWAELGRPRTERDGQTRHHPFSCSLPGHDRSPVSARILLQLGRGAEVDILGITYGFDTPPDRATP